MKVLLHVGRGGDGVRRLTEIAVLRRDHQTANCHAVTAWPIVGGHSEGAEELRRLVAAGLHR